MLILFVAVIGAITISAMCSLFEAVLYSVPIGEIETMVHDGKPSGRILRDLRRDVDRPISAILSLNTIANTAGAAVAGAAAVAVFGERSLVVFSAVFTLAILLFAEVIPKTAGVVYSRSLAGMIARPLQWLVRVFSPLVWLCRQVTRLIAKQDGQGTVSDRELVVMTRLGLNAGTIDADEAKVIENILELERKRAREIMTPRSVMITLPVDLPIGEARERPGVLTHSRIPVYDTTPDKIVGIVHRRNLLTAIGDGRGDEQLRTIADPVDLAGETLPLNKLLKRFLGNRRHMVVIIDEHGGTAGIVTLEDVLEEILGHEIVDEFDEVDDLRAVARQRRDDLFSNQEPSDRREGSDS